MDFVEGLIGAVLMLVFLVVVIGAIAALFMVVFGIATGIDDRIQNWARRAVDDLGWLGRLLIVVGIVLVLAGVVVVVADRTSIGSWLGRLPGDVTIRRGPVTVYIPLATSILLSVLLTIILSLVLRR
jgi:hypothetical protein